MSGNIFLFTNGFHVGHVLIYKKKNNLGCFVSCFRIYSRIQVALKKDVGLDEEDAGIVMLVVPLAVLAANTTL